MRWSVERQAKKSQVRAQKNNMERGATIRKQRARRKIRVRSRIFGTAKQPRLSVFRSNRSLYGQLIDDEHGRTLASVSTKKISKTNETKAKQAETAAAELGEKAKTLGITRAVFDKGAYRYHGRVKAFADGIRNAGIKI